MSRVKRYSLPIVLGVIAAALVAVGVLAVTVWRPSQQVVASRDSDQPYTMTRVGVFPLYGDEVNVRATAPDDQFVWVALGSPDDVTAWLQDEPYDEIVGLADLQTLKAIPHSTDEPQSGGDAAVDEQTEDGDEAESADAAVPTSPIQSDMWIAEKYGKGSVSLTLTKDEMDASILAATNGEDNAPTITLTWDTPQSNLLAVISFITAGVVALIAAAVAAGLAGAHSRRLTRSHELRTLDERADTTTTEIAVGSTTLGDDAEGEASSAVNADAESHAETGEDSVPTPAAADRFEPASEEQAAEENEAETRAQKADSYQQGDSTEPTAATSSDNEPAEAEEAPGSTPTADRAPKTTVEPSEAERLEAVRSETVTTESGMMNLSALQGGGAFPTRRALREAQRRGVGKLVVGGREFNTTSGRQDASDVDEVLGQRALKPQRWSEAMGETE